jgi:hypothetical protein
MIEQREALTEALGVTGISMRSESVKQSQAKQTPGPVGHWWVSKGTRTYAAPEYFPIRNVCSRDPA